jgi:hypothetical protein
MQKQELIETIESYYHRESRPSWNIKVYKTRPAVGDKKWNKRWNEYLETNCEDVYIHCCEDGLMMFAENWFLEGVDGFKWCSDYKFYTAGRSGGWLYLDSIEIDGVNVNLTELEDESYTDLKRLYKFIREVDKFDATKEMESQLDFRRERAEEEWEEELRDAKAEREKRNGERELINTYGSSLIFA